MGRRRVDRKTQEIQASPGESARTMPIRRSPSRRAIRTEPSHARDVSPWLGAESDTPTLARQPAVAAGYADLIELARSPIGSGAATGPGLRVSEPDDALEHEADRVADAVMAGSSGEQHVPAAVDAPVQRTCAGCGAELPCPGSCEREPAVAVQRTSAPSPSAQPVSPSALPHAMGSGSELAPAVRSDMEQRFGLDFAGVRVHSDGDAARSAQDLSARAYTVGNHIVFGDGEYQPGSATGRRLLAHELTHVVQQTAAPGGDVPIQRDKDKKPAALKPDFEKHHGDYYLAGYTIKGVTIRLGIGETDRARVEPNLVGIADAINEANQANSDPAFKVKICAISYATTRFTTYKRQPILSLAPDDANRETARHELGHATFDYLRAMQNTKSPFRDTALSIAEIYERLAATKPVKATERSLDFESGKVKDVEKERPAGLWIADPPQWKHGPGARSEHPWGDADEMFASAREAFLEDREGFAASIKRFAKLDPKVDQPASQLLAMLDALSKGKAPESIRPSQAAKNALSNIPSATPTEATLDSALNDTLRWALDPATWPWDKH